MSGSQAKWREEQILIICPGSRTTMAQLGCTELTPPMHRIPTRMFKDGDEWRPYHTFQRTKVVNGVEQEEWVEDVDEDKGATYPIQGGRIVQMDAFLAFLDHVHSLLTTTYHNTPIMLMASPQWTRPDCEAIAQYIFEKTRTPALCLIHSGIATQYGLKWPNMTVIDIGYEKVDVTAIHDGRVVNHMDVGASGTSSPISGGEVFTRRLMKLLEDKSFTHDMAEQLKKSSICEVLPYAAGETELMELPKDTAPAGPLPSGPAPAAAQAADASKPVEPAKPSTTSGDGNGEAEDSNNNNGDEDGVLDVAAIVTSGQTKEFLAKKEKEKGKPGRKPKVQDADVAPAKPSRLPNTKRKLNTFFYDEIIQELVLSEPNPNGTNGTTEEQQPLQEGESASAPGDAAATAASTSHGGDASSEPGDKPSEQISDGAPTAATEQPKAAAGQAENTTPETAEYRPKRVRRDVEVGLERFTFADRREIDRIVTAIYRTVQGVDDMYMRPQCWDNLVFVGNGSRLRGLKENILQTLHARHLISPSTATMFTSELPSNMATPSGTGSQTPTGSFTGVPHQLPTSGVNPLLQAATTASTLGVGAGGTGAAATPAAGSDAAGPAGHHFHSQTPTSIKTASLPGYLGEWTKNGFEEAMFLGAQVAARIAFSLHSNMDVQSVEAQRLMSLSRVDYK
ncbi:Actin-like protein arp9 (SWI/SNF complex component arp9) [Metarhizium rileyi]|uniref:Actin-like protein arp9 (SWI/SNF complex component arp9) n=1 Tax=Metarhizium rileyi (strain RCEF 4871) TaxID=1649241 RepID=A0A5C6GIM1_METRR|nr:Actin-like protein arp9 (SWI/SNF complex component arp9) [Metarhizium rileyi]